MQKMSLKKHFLKKKLVLQLLNKILFLFGLSFCRFLIIIQCDLIFSDPQDFDQSWFLHSENMI